jgi:DNA invertase Pin-like site-specific DNA recombinase
MTVTSPNRPHAYSYLRFSTPEQAGGDSLRRQTQAAVDYATQHGLELIDASYQDLGVSAYRGANAETGMLAEFMEAVRAGTIKPGSWLLIESMDRLSRAKPRKATRLLETICEEGITVVTLSDGKRYDEATLDDDPMAFLWAFMVATRANEESAMKSKRLQASWQNKRKLALGDVKTTSRAPTWLKLHADRRGFDVDKERAAVIRRIYQMTADGVGQHKIAGTLNREGVPTFGTGRQWHRSFIANLLNSDTVIGTYTPHVIEHVEGRTRRRPVAQIEEYYPAIIDRDLWATVRALMAVKSSQRGRHAHSTNTVANILGGVARCSRCGGAMTLVTKNKRDRYLVCTRAKTRAGCTYQSVRYDTVEWVVTHHADDWTVAQLDEGSDHPKAGELADLRLHIAVTRDQLGELINSGATSVTLRETIRELNAVLVELEAREQKLAESVNATIPALVDKRIDELRETLNAETLDRPRANRLIKQLIESAVIGLDDGAVTFRWRHGAGTEVRYDHGFTRVVGARNGKPPG